MDSEENQLQVSLRRPPPLEIAARFPHSHSPGRDRRGKVEIQQQDSHFPGRSCISLKTQKRKECDSGLIP
jgi:hypothetical protein